VWFIGTRRGPESRAVPAAGYRIRHIGIRGFLGKPSLDQALFPARFGVALSQSLWHLSDDRPDAVLGTGGYVCAPPVAAAWLLGIPAGMTALDVLPSRAIRLLAPLASQIYGGFPECADFIADRSKVVFTGNPLRPDIGTVAKRAGLETFGLSPDRRTVLVFGGSQGAHSLNRATAEALRMKQDDPRWQSLQFIIQTGQRDCENVRESLQGSRVKAVVLPVIDAMAHALAAADLAVCRSGSSVSELLACGLPSILVPFPHAAGNHQEYNARSLERRGAARLLLDRDLDGATLAREIDRLAFDHETLGAMAAAARQASRPQAATEIAHHLLSLISN
jgi:UDP-N-acetylglucosamine--N-acetylmuramyl-(pentapeptide) pyrophosphoryl-undecaprenol N-acetylglucosamine transferase